MSKHTTRSSKQQRRWNSVLEVERILRARREHHKSKVTLVLGGANGLRRRTVTVEEVRNINLQRGSDGMPASISFQVLGLDMQWFRNEPEWIPPFITRVFWMKVCK